MKPSLAVTCREPPFIDNAVVVWYLYKELLLVLLQDPVKGFRAIAGGEL